MQTRRGWCGAIEKNHGCSPTDGEREVGGGERPTFNLKRSATKSRSRWSRFPNIGIGRQECLPHMWRRLKTHDPSELSSLLSGEWVPTFGTFFFFVGYIFSVAATPFLIAR